MSALSDHLDLVKGRRASLMSQFEGLHEGERRDHIRKSLADIEDQIRTLESRGLEPRKEVGMSATLAFQPILPDERPQDPDLDAAGWTFELTQHGGDLRDFMPQAIFVTDAEGRQATYVPLKQNGRIGRYIVGLGGRRG